MPAAPARRINSRRSYLPSRRLGSSELATTPPFSALPECSPGEAGDEPVEERVVEERERNARYERGDHDRSPLRQIAADQIRIDTRGQRAMCRRGDERERVDELVHDEREREDDHGQDARDRDRKDDADEGSEP